MNFKKIKIIFLLLIVILPLILSYYNINNPYKVNINQKFESSSSKYILGTDNMGRCEYTRLVESGKTTIEIVLFSSIIIILFGTFIGLILSINREKNFRIIFSSFLDAITAIPTIVYLIIIVGVYGNSIFTMMLALTITIILRLIKYVVYLSIDEQRKAYFICAKCLGASNYRLLFIHILPNILDRIFSFVSLSCAEMIMMISGFSFIGLTLGDKKIDWGFMLNEGRSFISTKPSLVYFPMILIILYALLFNELAKIIKEKN